MSERAWLFTVLTAGRQPLLTRPELLGALRDALSAGLGRSGWSVLGLVILPDHIHAVLRPPAGRGHQPPDWRAIKTDCARRVRQAWPDAPRQLWHDGHEARRLESEGELVTELQRLHADPVRHRLAETPAEWPWSTYGRAMARPARRRPQGRLCDAPPRRLVAAVLPAARLCGGATGPLLWR